MTDCVPPTEEPLLLRREEAAALLAVAPKTIQRLTDSGQLASVRIGRCVRYRRDQLTQLIEVSTCLDKASVALAAPRGRRSVTGFDPLPKLEERARAKQRARAQTTPTLAAAQPKKR